MFQLLSRNLWRNKQSVDLKFQKSPNSAFNINWGWKFKNNCQLQIEIHWFWLKSVYFIHCRVSILVFTKIDQLIKIQLGNLKPERKTFLKTHFLLPSEKTDFTSKLKQNNFHFLTKIFKNLARHENLILSIFLTKV